jgi:hypothetical protein
LHPFHERSATVRFIFSGSTSSDIGGNQGNYEQIAKRFRCHTFSDLTRYIFTFFLVCYSRLLVRLAGLFTLAFSAVFLTKMLRIVPSKHKLKAIEKNSYHALRVVKQLGRGGPMKYFLKHVHPFTRSIRILVAVWRWIESAQCRRGEVGTEEAMVRVYIPPD